MSEIDKGPGVQKPIDKHGIGLFESEVMWVSNAHVLQDHFHQLAASQFRTRGIVENVGPVLLQQLFALPQAIKVIVLQLDPEVRLEFLQGFTRPPLGFQNCS